MTTGEGGVCVWLLCGRSTGWRNSARLARGIDRLFVVFAVMFDWENDFVKELKKENPKETKQKKYEAVEKSLKDGSETWASLERTLQSETGVALDAAWPQLSAALELEDEVHKIAVTQAVTAALDDTALNPMRKWLTEQVCETFRIETFDSNYFKQR